MIQNLSGMHALVILAVVVLIFGASKLPALAKSVGQSVKILKKESSDSDPGSDTAQPKSRDAMPNTAEAPRQPVPLAAPSPEQREQRTS